MTSAATMTGGSAGPTLEGWQRGILVGATLGVALMAWILLAGASLEGTASVGGAPTPLFVVAMWLLMCVAMMLPTSLPWLAVMAALSHDRAAGRGIVTGALTAAFGTGYLTVWAAFAIAAAGLQIALQRFGAASLAPVPRATVLAVLLLLAGAYQLTGAKQACLRHCRNPLGYFLSRWLDGRVGAFRMGALHGVRCLGCCWALMLLMLGVGTMNVAWMAGLTVVTALEQTFPNGRRLARAFGGVFLLWGALLLLATWRAGVMV